MRASTLSYCILCHVWLLSLRGLLSSERKQRRCGSGDRRGMDLGGMDGGETMVGMFCMREESVFN